MKVIVVLRIMPVGVNKKGGKCASVVGSFGDENTVDLIKKQSFSRIFFLSKIEFLFPNKFETAFQSLLKPNEYLKF